MTDRIGLSVAMFVLGLILGPWLGIAVDRVVDRVSFKAEHRCIHCQQSQTAASLVPVLSWFKKCPGCSQHPGLRYPLVDLATAFTFAALAFLPGLRCDSYRVVGHRL